MIRDSRWWGACRAGVAVVLLASLAAAGCGGGRNVAPVSGKVTYAGEPLANGTVAFVGEDGRTDSSPLKEDGSYLIAKAPIGPVKIGVQTFPPSPMVIRPDAPPSAATKPNLKYVRLPPRYNDPNKSGLTYTVQPGPQTHDIPLPK